MARKVGSMIVKEGRKYIVVESECGSGPKLTTYARYVYEQAYGPILDADLQVDHINEDKTDDRLENLQLLHWVDNLYKSRKAKTYVRLVCDNCGEKFNRSLKEHNRSIKDGNKRFYCCRECYVVSIWRCKD